MNADPVEGAIKAAEEFVQHYYHLVDKLRNKIVGLYHQDATLVWNGNHISQKENIKVFLQNLPTSRHAIQSLDAQPVKVSAQNKESTVLITATGMVVFEKEKHTFLHSFVITAQDKVWKIVSESYRWQ